MRPSLLVLLLLLAGCIGGPRLPAIPADATTVVLESPDPPRTCFANAYGAFLQAGWSVLTTSPSGFGFSVQPDATDAIVEIVVQASETDPDDAVLTASLDPDTPGRRDVLERTARLLTRVPGTIRFR